MLVAEATGTITVEEQSEVWYAGKPIALHAWARYITRLKALNMGDVPVVLEIRSMDLDLQGLKFMIEPFSETLDHLLDVPLNYQTRYPGTRIEAQAKKMAPSPEPAVVCFALRLTSEPEEAEG